MSIIRYTLLSDGSSDRALIPILTWLLKNSFNNCPVQSTYADLRRLPQPPRILAERIITAVDLFPCDILFVHRDAERQTRDSRKREIENAIADALPRMILPPVICVIPVRMGEAWLLFDEAAIRKASGNPNGRIPLRLPNIPGIEALPNPKSILHQLLQSASQLTGRRLKKLNINKCVHLVAEFVNEFTPLRDLPAFIALEADVNARRTTTLTA